jgi:hypothetical protein
VTDHYCKSISDSDPSPHRGGGGGEYLSSPSRAQTMKALSVIQPWATLLVCGAKRLETRSWKTSYRGSLLIVASRKFPEDCRRLCSIEPFRRPRDRHCRMEIGARWKLGNDETMPRMKRCPQWPRRLSVPPPPDERPDPPKALLRRLGPNKGESCISGKGPEAAATCRLLP